jgi:hypothetical protein
MDSEKNQPAVPETPPAPEAPTGPYINPGTISQRSEEPPIRPTRDEPFWERGKPGTWPFENPGHESQ